MASAFVVYSIANGPGKSANASRTQFPVDGWQSPPYPQKGTCTKQEDYQLKELQQLLWGSTGLKVQQAPGVKKAF